MVTREQIVALPRKYAIGKRPLSRILGWGELTYTRILEGSTPSPRHEEELLRALNEPLTYMMLLERAHDAGLVADLSYERSRNAAMEYLGEDDATDDTLKVHAVAKRLCALANGDITPHALQLLTYYAHGRSMAKLADPLFEQLPYAAEGGPAYSALESWFTFDHIQEVGACAPEEADGVLSEEEAKLVDAVFAEYGVYSATKLQELACSEAPWRKTMKRASELDDPGDAVEIPAKTMRKFFKKGAK